MTGDPVAGSDLADEMVKAAEREGISTAVRRIGADLPKSLNFTDHSLTPEMRNGWSRVLER